MVATGIYLKVYAAVQEIADGGRAHQDVQGLSLSGRELVIGAALLLKEGKR